MDNLLEYKVAKITTLPGEIGVEIKTVGCRALQMTPATDVAILATESSMAIADRAIDQDNVLSTM